MAVRDITYSAQSIGNIHWKGAHLCCQNNGPRYVIQPLHCATWAPGTALSLCVYCGQALERRDSFH